MEEHTRLVTKQVGDEPWVAAELLGLPDGPEYRIYKPDTGDGVYAILVRFPAGYLEPQHTHDAEHWGIVVEGEMHVDGKILKPGDFHHAPAHHPHGPFYYPKGCIVFGTTRGGSIFHNWEPEHAAIDPATVEVRPDDGRSAERATGIDVVGLRPCRRQAWRAQASSRLEATVPLFANWLLDPPPICAEGDPEASARGTDRHPQGVVQPEKEDLP